MESKPWYASKGVWGSIVGIAAVAAGVMGYTIAPEDQETVVVSLAAAGSAVGALVALYGRLKANKTIGK